jgi:oxygen-independent coproporphyrinogen-3 oxidase
MSSTRQPPRAAYIHVPFCAHRCGYCNFTLIAGRDDLIDQYLAALAQELAHLDHPRSVDTLFLGGGTPTHLPPPQLEQLLSLARHWFQLSPGGEFSVEMNPRDTTAQRVDLLAQHGVNRISLGVQSFQADKLRRLDRDHAPQEIENAWRLLRPCFDNLSLDLIFAAPDETLATWQDDLATAIQLRPQHISSYGLTFERGTRFWSQRTRGDVHSLSEELERDFYLAAIDTLTAAGYEHYEVSNFAQPGRRCRHNEVYWAGEEYYAAGPGAARYVDGWREINHRSTSTYLQRVRSGQSPVAERECLSPEDRARELLVIGLRRMSGVDLNDFARRCGYTLEQLAAQEIDELISQGLLSREGRQLKLTRHGLLLSDAIWPRLLRA